LTWVRTNAVAIDKADLTIVAEGHDAHRRQIVARSLSLCSDGNTGRRTKTPFQGIDQPCRDNGLTGLAAPIRMLPRFASELRLIRTKLYGTVS
jgi:hypothetical protein